MNQSTQFIPSPIFDIERNSFLKDKALSSSGRLDNRLSFSALLYREIPMGKRTTVLLGLGYRQRVFCLCGYSYFENIGATDARFIETNETISLRNFKCGYFV